jgi:peptidoglycan hydrolase-like protein with peptidoglycan-binding domain
LGFNAGKVDGIIGPNTRGAILRLQNLLGTKADGYVGPKTRALLNNSCEGGNDTDDLLNNVRSYLKISPKTYYNGEIDKFQIYKGNSVIKEYKNYNYKRVNEVPGSGLEKYSTF